ncbi:hypothetical protein KIPB_007406, partial [Kipferlia bialata]
DMAALPVVVRLYTSDTLREIPLSTPVGMLKSLLTPSDLGCLVLNAVFEVDSDSDDTQTESDTAPAAGTACLVDTPFPTVSSRSLATVPGIGIDTDTLIFTGQSCVDAASGTSKDSTPLVMTLLTPCRGAVLTLCGGEVKRVVAISNVPQPSTTSGPKRVAVSTQGGMYHILSVLSSGSSATDSLVTLYAIKVVNGVCAWTPVDMDVSEEAQTILQDCFGDTAAVVVGRDSDNGSLIVCLGANEHLSHILRLDTTTPTPTLSLSCRLSSRLPAAGVTEVTCSGDTALIAYGRAGSTTPSAMCVTLKTGGMYDSTVCGEMHRYCSVGTVFKSLSQSGASHAGTSELCVAVKDWQCVPLRITATQYSFQGTTLIYLDASSTLHITDLAPLLDTHLLPVGLPNDAPSVVPWRDSSGAGSRPFTPTLQASLGMRVVIAALDSTSYDIVGLAEFNCASGTWTTTLTPSSGVVDTVTDKALVVGDHMYACVKGQLLSVPLAISEATPTTLYPLSLTGQPVYALDTTVILCPTASGIRVQRVLPPATLLDKPIVYPSEGTSALGECVGLDCINGVLTDNTGFYDIKSCVWCPVREVGTTDKTVSGAIARTHVQTGSEALSLLLLGTESVTVTDAVLEDVLANMRPSGWRFTNCTLSTLSGATVRDCSFEGCNFTECILTGTTLINCTFSKCSFANATASNTSMVNVTMRECDQTDMSFKGCTMSGHNTGVELQVMRNRDLSADDMSDVTSWDMTGSRVTGCDLTAVKGLTVEQLSSLSALTKCTLKGMDLRGVDLSGTDATGSDFSYANLSGCDVSGATLSGCNLSGATLTEVKGLTQEHLTTICRGTGVVLSGVDMRGWDLRKVDLRNADLSGCQLAGTMFRDTRVVGATLPYVCAGPVITPEPTAEFEVTPYSTANRIAGQTNGSEHNLSLTIPSVDGSRTWRIQAKGTQIYLGSLYMLYCREQGTITITRSGTSVSFSSSQHSRSGSVPCSHGLQVRIPMRVYTCTQHGPMDVTLSE